MDGQNWRGLKWINLKNVDPPFFKFISVYIEMSFKHLEQLMNQSYWFVKHQKKFKPQDLHEHLVYECNMYACSLHNTYQLFQPFYEPEVLDFVVLDNHSHTVTATGSKGTSMFVVCEDLSLVFRQETTPACVLDHHATENKKFRL